MNDDVQDIIDGMLDDDFNVDDHIGGGIDETSPFYNLDRKFNTPSIPPPETKIINTVVPVVRAVKVAGSDFKDEEYIALNLRELTERSMKVLDDLAEEIKVGSGPRVYEVYATLAGSIADSLSKLTDLNDRIAKQKLNRKKLNVVVKQKSNAPVIGKDNISMTSAQLLEFMREAQKKSLMHEVKAEFETSSNNKDEKDTVDEVGQ